MKTLLKLSLACALTVGLAAVAAAGDAVTLEGSLMCAKCARGEAADCQDVLVVAEGDAEGGGIRQSAVDRRSSDGVVAGPRLGVDGLGSPLSSGRLDQRLLQGAQELQPPDCGEKLLEPRLSPGVAMLAGRR